MPVTEPSLPPDALRLASRRASVARQLDLMIDLRGPVEQVRRLIADLDGISSDLAKALRGEQVPAARAASPRDSDR